MLDARLRHVLDSPAIAHLATICPDGSPLSTPVYIGLYDDRPVFFTGPGTRKARNLHRDPRVAISIAPADDPFVPVMFRGRVDEWITGEDAWSIIDRIVAKYIDLPYPRADERAVAVVSLD